MQSVSFVLLLLKCCSYVVGTSLPPLLPSVFTVSVGVSADRLVRKGITCTQPETILVAGKVSTALFDKTGTLTKQGMDYLSVRSMRDWNSSTSTAVTPELALGMAACHTLSVTSTGDFIGNPVDRIMFESSKAQLKVTNGVFEITDINGQQVKVVKVFDFDHHRMSQSVILQTASGSMVVYVKGSGESIKRKCISSSLPKDYDYCLRESSKQGIYQISMATKTLPFTADVGMITRDEIEQDLTFIGAINFKNTIRESTPDVIRQLVEGDVKSVMVTGDSVLTGVCIAKEAGIISGRKELVIGSVDEAGAVLWSNESDETLEMVQDFVLEGDGVEIAVSGECWDTMSKDDPKKAARMLKNIRVFGRCTPQDKVSIVTAFIEQGRVTVMVGDGGNDCGALKTAHIGVALSDAEASIVAPFTSLDKDIGSVVEVLKEGRCALASALASYKYMIMYGQVESMNQLINAYFLISFTEWCWVFMDGLWTISLAFTLPLAMAAKKLSPNRPTSSLLNWNTLASALGVLFLNFVFTVISLFYLWSQPWFQCRKVSLM
jgi:magnesium-transporting ATPase (P-type)